MGFLFHNLMDRETWQKFANDLGVRPPAKFGVVVTTSVTRGLAEVDLSRHVFIALDDLEDNGVGLVIEPRYLAVQLKTDAATHAADPVGDAAGLRHLRVGERDFKFGSDKQRQIINHSFKAWEGREANVIAAVMFEEPEFRSSSRVRDIFKGHGDWHKLLEVAGGS